METPHHRRRSRRFFRAGPFGPREGDSLALCDRHPGGTGHRLDRVGDCRRLGGPVDLYPGLRVYRVLDIHAHHDPRKREIARDGRSLVGDAGGAGDVASRFFRLRRQRRYRNPASLRPEHDGVLGLGRRFADLFHRAEPETQSRKRRKASSRYPKRYHVFLALLFFGDRYLSIGFQLDHQTIPLSSVGDAYLRYRQVGEDPGHGAHLSHRVLLLPNDRHTGCLFSGNMGH